MRPFLVAPDYAGLIRNTPGLLGYWRMTEQSGTVMRDQLMLANGAYGGAPVLGFTGPVVDGASAKFNGTSHFASIAKNLSAVAQCSVSFWMYWDAFANDDDLAMEYTPNAFNSSVKGFYVDPNESSTSAFAIGFTFIPLHWRDRFPRPTAARWHHYLICMDRAAPANTAFVDGVAQTLTTITHNAGTYGTFDNSSLYLMSRGGAALFAPGRMSELALFNRVMTNAEAATQYSVGLGR